MTRAMSPALVVLVGALAMPLAANAAPTGEAWSLFLKNEDAVIYTRPNAAKSLYPQVWQRFEYTDPFDIGGRSYRSEVFLIEYYCDERTSRAVASTLFERPNLSGVSRSAPESYQRTHVIPGSIAEALLEQACAAK